MAVRTVTPHASLLNPASREEGIYLLRRIEHYGRVSHASQDKMTAESWQRFIPTVVMGHGDWSIVEHASASVIARVDRGITHEWVRHRLFSYTQASTRFIRHSEGRPAEYIEPPELTTEQFGQWRAAITAADNAYNKMLELGCTPQIARSVFPNALASQIVITGNLRAWRHFFVMRTTKEAHPQMREVAVPLLAEFKASIPLIFDDIRPFDRQVDAMKLPR